MLFCFGCELQLNLLTFGKNCLFARVIQMGCCGCFGFSSSKKPRKWRRRDAGMGNHGSRELLLDEELEDVDDCSNNGDLTDTGHGDDGEIKSPTKRSEEIILYRTQHGLICREFPVKETHKLIRSEVSIGVRLRSYGLTVVY